MKSVVLLGCASLLAIPRLEAQRPADFLDTLRFDAAFLRTDSAKSAGLRWLAAKSIQSGWRGDVLPRRVNLEFQTAGALAFDAEANSETITAAIDGGAFVSLYKAGDFGGNNPNAPTTSGFNFGSARLMLRGSAEGQQGNGTINVKGGGVLRYTTSERVWFVIPSFDVAYELVKPVDTDTTAAAARDTHGRLDAAGYWTLPLPAVPMKIFGDLHHWRLGNADTTSLESGTFGGAALAWVRSFRIAAIEIPSVFLRWSGGARPIDQRERKAWTLGIVAYRASD